MRVLQSVLRAAPRHWVSASEDIEGSRGSATFGRQSAMCEEAAEPGRGWMAADRPSSSSQTEHSTASARHRRTGHYRVDAAAVRSAPPFSACDRRTMSTTRRFASHLTNLSTGRRGLIVREHSRMCSSLSNPQVPRRARWRALERRNSDLCRSRSPARGSGDNVVDGCIWAGEENDSKADPPRSAG